MTVVPIQKEKIHGGKEEVEVAISPRPNYPGIDIGYKNGMHYHINGDGKVDRAYTVDSEGKPVDQPLPKNPTAVQRDAQEILKTKTSEGAKVLRDAVNHQLEGQRHHAAASPN